MSNQRYFASKRFFVLLSGPVQSYYSAAANFALLYAVSQADVLTFFRFSFLLADLHHTILYYSIKNIWYNTYKMINFNDVGRPLCRIVGGKYDKKVISVSDKFSSKDDDETMMKEFRLLKIPNDAKLQQIPDTTKER